MKKIIYLLLLAPIIYLASCSKSSVTPQVESNIEETIVGKTWKLLDSNAGYFHLNADYTYLTKSSFCDSLQKEGVWELDENILIFRYIDGPLEYVERNTIIEFNDSIVKVQADTSANLNINLIFETTDDVIRGCMDSTATNFNADAVCPLECIYSGCTDEFALNYNPFATIDDGSCVYIAGCTNPLACNYDPVADFDDGSCIIPDGCTDPTAYNYDANALCNDGSCCFIAGCMDISAYNYDPNACFDNGTCIFVEIGDNFQGGIIFWLDGNGGGLIAAPSDIVPGNGSGGIWWGCYGTVISGADGEAIGTGNQNTIDIIAECPTSLTNSLANAAEFCANLSDGTYNDWYLPSKDELRKMYLNIGPGNALGLGNIGGFDDSNSMSSWYWSSTEYDATQAWYQSFSVGNMYLMPKSNFLKVRAIRAF